MYKSGMPKKEMKSFYWDIKKKKKSFTGCDARKKRR